MTTIPLVLGVPDWLVLPGAVLGWIALLWIGSRLLLRGHDRLHCPRSGRMARVQFVRAPDGARAEIVRCSLWRAGRRDCHAECLRS